MKWSMKVNGIEEDWKSKLSLAVTFNVLDLSPGLEQTGENCNINPAADWSFLQSSVGGVVRQSCLRHMQIVIWTVRTVFGRATHSYVKG